MSFIHFPSSFAIALSSSWWCPLFEAVKVNLWGSCEDAAAAAATAVAVTRNQSQLVQNEELSAMKRTPMTVTSLL